MRRLGWSFGIAAMILLVAASLAAGAARRSEHQTSDDFWHKLGLSGAQWTYQYDSLDQLVAGADTVVLGRVTAIERGRSFGTQNPSDEPFRMASLTVAVDDVIRWDPRLPAQTALTLEERIGAWDSLPALADGIPGGQTVFVLSNRGLAAARAGLNPDVQTADAPYFQELNDLGTWRNLDGRVDRAPGEPYDWVAPVDGSPFESFMASVRASAEAAAQASRQ
jgi:hypothetical protein